MRPIWIQVQTRLTTKYEIGVKICILFLIKAVTIQKKANNYDTKR